MKLGIFTTPTRDGLHIKSVGCQRISPCSNRILQSPATKLIGLALRFLRTLFPQLKRESFKTQTVPSSSYFLEKELVALVKILTRYKTIGVFNQ